MHYAVPMNIATDQSQHRMLGKSNRFGCGCCTDDARKPSRRASRRREKQALRKILRSES